MLKECAQIVTIVMEELKNHGFAHMKNSMLVVFARIATSTNIINVKEQKQMVCLKKKQKVEI